MRLEVPHSYSHAVGMWVGKLAYLTADAMTIQEGIRAIAQAVSDHCQVKVRGSWISPCVNLPVQQSLLVQSP